MEFNQDKSLKGLSDTQKKMIHDSLNVINVITGQEAVDIFNKLTKKAEKEAKND